MTRQTALVALTAVALLTGVVTTAHGADGIFAEAGVFLRKYETNSVAIIAGFVPDSSRIMLGEPTFLTFSVSNVATQTFHFSHVRNEIFSITASNSNGLPVKSRYSGLDGNGFLSEVTISPGKAYSSRVFLNERCAFAEPGEYTVTCRANLSDYMNRSNSLGQPVVTVIKLSVWPTDPQRLTEIINAWGQTVQTNGALDEAVLALDHIDDARTIPYLALLVTRGLPTSYLAVNALARFTDSVAAADALTVACKAGDDSVAGRAGAALRNMHECDRAARTLLPSLLDPDAGVRIHAVRSVSWIGSPLAFDPLRTCLQDANNLVRYAAAEAIGRLGDGRSFAVLTNCLGESDMTLRIAAVKGLLALKTPLRADWLTPIILSGGENIGTYYEAIDLLRMYGGDEAAPGLASCLHFDDPSVRHSHNFRLMLALEYSPNGPKYYYRWHHDPNRDGTEQELTENRQILSELKAWFAEMKHK